MNLRETMLSLVYDATPPSRTPAAFFMHFDPACHQGQAAIDKHLEYFRATGMDFVKIQYEQRPPAIAPIQRAADWANLPLVDDAFFAATFGVVEGIVKAARADALVIMTLYSPFMWANQMAGADVVAAHLRENPEAVAKGLAITTENVLRLVRGCRQLGVDGFYASTQGGETFRFGGSELFTTYIKPTDLAVWEELQACQFNILHVCDYAGAYDDLTPFLDYPGHVVNCSLHIGDTVLSPKDAARRFGRPFMGGLERKGVLATGDAAAARLVAADILHDAPERFILGADCTVPSETPWENLRAVIDAAHQR